jgi:hypothetical protein
MNSSRSKQFRWSFIALGPRSLTVSWFKDVGFVSLQQLQKYLTEAIPFLLRLEGIYDLNTKSSDYC